jgi:hypothetical protein
MAVYDNRVTQRGNIRHLNPVGLYIDDKPTEVAMSKPLDFGAVIVAAIMILGPMALGASGMG